MDGYARFVNEEKRVEDSLGFVEFSDQLASKAPTPGGGGASAAVGALSCALGQMVCNLTLGKEKYASVEDEVQTLVDELEAERREMLALVDEDAAAFEPLSKAYSIPKDAPGRDEVMEAALSRACEPPLQIMELAARVIDQLARLAEIGSRMAISDVGVAAVFAKAALEGASLNVYINAGSMKDESKARALSGRADELIAVCATRAQQAFDSIAENLKG